MPVAKEKRSSWQEKGSTDLEDGERQQLEGTFLEDGSRVLKKGERPGAIWEEGRAWGRRDSGER